MNYATLQGLTDRFGADMISRLTDHDVPASGLPGQQTIDRACADTDAVIDGYLRRRYATPLREVPPQITDIALSIAIYKLHRWSPEEKIAQDYKDAMKSLREIAEGVIVLTSIELAPKELGGSGARMTDRERPLTAENLKGYI